MNRPAGIGIQEWEQAVQGNDERDGAGPRAIQCVNSLAARHLSGGAGFMLGSHFLGFFGQEASEHVELDVIPRHIESAGERLGLVVEAYLAIALVEAERQGLALAQPNAAGVGHESQLVETEEKEISFENVCQIALGMDQ